MIKEIICVILMSVASVFATVYAVIFLKKFAKIIKNSGREEEEQKNFIEGQTGTPNAKTWAYVLSLKRGLITIVCACAVVYIAFLVSGLRCRSEIAKDVILTTGAGLFAFLGFGFFIYTYMTARKNKIPKFNNPVLVRGLTGMQIGISFFYFTLLGLTIYAFLALCGI